MSANRETSHDMATETDIALLLAQAADEVEIGMAPYQAVLRGGRRRKTRRWATAAAAALVIAGSTGTLALAGGTGTDDGGRRVAPAVTAPSTPKHRHVYEPRMTMVASARDNGKDWSVTVVTWGAPKNEAEAQYQRSQMSEYGLTPTGTETASDLIGKSWIFVRLLVEDGPSTTIQDGPADKSDADGSTDLEVSSRPLETGRPGAAGRAERLVIGKADPTVRALTCTWDDGTSVPVPMAGAGDGFGLDLKPMIHRVAGSPANWFVCLAPEGRSYKSVRVDSLT
ncbi:hypothetical protein ACH4S8_20325 [Streptomyces sp. NPDC021080]|uniref:hypothetical protein n=1 Tax=Streptomyces sp. NPDC021080 TaxID=3365110 RepID=UPI0037B9553A